MNSKAAGQISPASNEAQPIKRRGLLAGAGAVGAAAVAVKLLPGAAPAAATAPVAAAAKAIDTDGGYRLTAHVKRYYETTKA